MQNEILVINVFKNEAPNKEAYAALWKIILERLSAEKTYSAEKTP